MFFFYINRQFQFIKKNYKNFQKYSFNRNYDEMSVFRKFRCYLCIYRNLIKFIYLVLLKNSKTKYCYSNFNEISIFISISFILIENLYF